MTDVVTVPATVPLLYSQVDYDERGNFTYDGDLRCEREALVPLCRRIVTHLAGAFVGAHFSVRGESFTGGRKIIVELLDASMDLTNETVRNSFQIAVRDQVERFGFTRANVYQDYMSCAFYCDVKIGGSYWAALAARRGPANPVRTLVTLAAFRRLAKPGDALRLVHSSFGHRYLGMTRTIVAVRSADLILEGPSYLTLPRAAGFACDGRMVRIAVGSGHDPDAHLLYEWLPAAP